jgi:hypothetical protein
MTRRRTSLALLCAFVFCAFATQSAMAQVGTKSANTTAVTCVKSGGEEDFADSHCDDYVGPGNGPYGHKPINSNETAEIEITQVGTSKLNGTLVGLPLEIVCKKAASVAGKSFIHNVDAEGKHTVTGTAQISLGECEVSKTSCVVTDIVITATAVGVEGLNGQNEMGLEFVGEGFQKTLAELIFHPMEAQKCAFNNGTKPIPLRGSMIATGIVAQGYKQSGATWDLQDTSEMETLDIGLKKFSLAATFTTRMAAGENPISLTTVT